MRKSWRYAAIAAVAAASLALSACGDQKESGGAEKPTTTAPSGGTAQSSTPPASSAATPNAEALVKANCISCHGDTLDGKGSEKKNLTKVGSRLSKEQIVTQITNGGGGMGAFKDKLKADEIEAIAVWLAAKK
ncbi:c-type cytochrome [Paenibacillus flagellatus]|uniref:Cytochrome C n=1 Tax=Paenibacillus flagellatus TaxID=2211139 RepID=A0A2V5K483_9BACL|nr:c-type cytochrome [Paenibacillus flagellatus]PYI53512.1 cytochrome C [Paenibacillus flagellatus]